MTRVDAVVVSYNSRHTLRDCVEPLLRAPGVEVQVVDNASTDGCLETIADLNVNVIETGRNGGFGFGCNTGFAAGDAPYVLFVNPDARIDPGDVAGLVAALDEDGSAGLVGPRLLDEDGRLVPSQRRYQRVGSTWAQAFFLHRFIRRAAWANEIIHEDDVYEQVSHPEWVSGACMLARRETLAALGGFDEGFFLYCEDMDLCARLRAAGHTIRYEPSVTVHHAGGQSAPRTSLFAVLARSRVRFARQHAGVFSAAAQRIGLGVHAVTHLIAAIGRPAHARGHAAAMRAVLKP